MTNDQSFLSEKSARREFLGRVGKVAVTAPAVALLLTASAQPAAAQYRQTPPPRTRDRFWPLR